MSPTRSALPNKKKLLPTLPAREMESKSSFVVLSSKYFVNNKYILKYFFKNGWPFIFLYISIVSKKLGKKDNWEEKEGIERSHQIL